ncbi:uncharacterized protein LOC110465102 [Mizuhopecten yessoensis]|uniref:Oligopeptidase A n=1 Tax=Mizuhopecten yessoensis TaxID=6573 RepID=A0A210PSA5_MIZYE|nr:uncharacterized protein LOC110465102 [Mizuhopecten yessoensis]OWF39373.1 Oligopeptidase A [Mizuhopecten yessoensis]
MAASVIRGSAFLVKSMKCLRTPCHLPFSVPMRRIRYFIALPETPNDTPESNPLLRTEDVPHFYAISPKQVVRGCAKLSLDFERKVDTHFSSFEEDPSKPRTFENLVAPVDALHAPLQTAMNNTQILTWLRNIQPYIDAKARADTQVHKALHAIYTSEAYVLLKDLYKHKESMTDEEITLLEKMLYNCQKAGLELTGKTQDNWDFTMTRIDECVGDFGKRAIACKRLFSHTITDRKLMKRLPEELIYNMSLNPRNPMAGPWKVTLEDTLYHTFLKYCPDAEERHNIWYAYNNVSSTDFVSQYMDTHRLIDDIVRFRKHAAEDLGYENHAQSVMEPTMAGSVAVVLNMVEELRNSYLPQAEAEIDALQEFAENDGFEDELKLSDIPYYRQMQRETLFNEEEVSQYFMYKDVVEGAMELASQMFGIKFKYSEKRFPDEIYTFDAFDEEGKLIGQYILDPYRREDKYPDSWIFPAKARCENPVLSPYSYHSLNLDRADPCLSWIDLGSFYQEFGLFLQLCLTKTKYFTLSNDGTERDIRAVLGYLLLQFTMDPDYLQKISKHVKTGEKIPMPVIQTLLQANQHMAGWDLCHRLFKIAYDFEINLSHENWYSTLEKIWPIYMPIPLDMDDNHPCGDLNQFSNEGATSTYHMTWSEMVACDILEAFKDAGSLTDPNVLQEVGPRLRDSFFHPLGTVKAKELFRRFRGRDPSTEPFKAHNKIIN